MLSTLLLAALLTPLTAAQAAPPPASMPAQPATLNNGACLDSARAVPHVLQAPVVRAMQVVRIDKVVSTATMMDGQIIGYLYGLQDGTTWLGQRAPDYVSPATATQINQVLASTHAAGTTVTEFPAQTRLGIPTKAAQYFKVDIPTSAYAPLKIEIQPCVAWPAGQQLPDPTM